MTVRYDLVVSGGGPAGSALAAIAARHGARVLVVERRSLEESRVTDQLSLWMTQNQVDVELAMQCLLRIRGESVRPGGHLVEGRPIPERE